MVPTGVAEFGAHSYGVLSMDDLARLTRMAVMGAQANPSEGFATRQLIRRMKGFITKPDLVMLAELMKLALVQAPEWLVLAQELVDKAGL